jgi:hypothetical protein
METEHAIKIMRALANGHDPATGEPLQAGNLCLSAENVKALKLRFPHWFSRNSGRAIGSHSAVYPQLRQSAQDKLQLITSIRGRWQCQFSKPRIAGVLCRDSSSSYDMFVYSFASLRRKRRHQRAAEPAHYRARIRRIEGE